jgi:hypothetical protein
VNPQPHLIAAIVLAALPSPIVSAAEVDYWLIDDGPGVFKITATVTGDDHAGISGYGFDLLGGVATLQHLSPASLAGQTSTTTGPAGFTLARSKDDVSYAAGFQNIVDPDFVPIYGLGSRTSSFSAEGVTPLGTPRSASWDAELLLAKGTYTGSFESLAFNPYGPNSAANVFNAVGQSHVRMPESYSFHRVRTDSTTELFARIEPGAIPSSPTTTASPNLTPSSPPQAPNPIPPIPDPVLPDPILPPITPAETAAVEFRLIDSGPGAFKITAKVSGGAQAGLSGYGLDLLGNITSLQHVSPGSAEVTTAAASGPAGFTLARSRDDVSYLAGFQNLIDPNFAPIYGMGSQASSFAAEGVTPLDLPRVTDWDAELLLATGTYTGSFESLGVNSTGPNTGANVFAALGQTQVRIPELISFVRVSASTTETLAVIDRLAPTPPAPPLDPPTNALVDTPPPFPGEDPLRRPGDPSVDQPGVSPGFPIVETPPYPPSDALIDEGVVTFPGIIDVPEITFIDLPEWIWNRPLATDDLIDRLRIVRGDVWVDDGPGNILTWATAADIDIDASPLVFGGLVVLNDSLDHDGLQPASETNASGATDYQGALAYLASPGVFNGTSRASSAPDGVPEPSSLALAAAGLLGLSALSRRRP